ncbi:MAG: MDR family MFS transporter [Corynebacterium sp.]|nr:MDR family MFS transporter [Corynebacterium sp.]
MTPEPSVPESKNRIGMVFAGLLVAMFLSALDQTIFATALPTIVGELSGIVLMLWVTTGYLLAATVTMPIYGKLGDIIGRKGLFLAALVLFLVGSVIGGLAPNMVWLILARVVQGVGGGGLLILSQAIIADIVPVRDRAKYMGAMGAVFGLSSVVGPILGGWFTESIGWQWVFWINIPIGVIAIAIALFVLRLPKHDVTFRFDVWGTLTMAVAVTAIILVASWGGVEYEWGSSLIVNLIIVAIVFTALFVWAEAKASDPIIPLKVFKNRNFILATIGGVFINIAMFGVLSYLPTYLQMVTDANATGSSLMLTVMMAGLMCTALTTGALSSKTGKYKWMPIASMLVLAVGLWLMSTLTVDTALWILLAYTFVFGAGIGFGMQILVVVVQNSFPDQEVGMATASNNFFREIGASLGGAFVGAQFTSRLTSLFAERMPDGAGINTNALTPGLVKQLPETIQNAIVGAYNNALTPVFALIIPMMAAGLLAVVFIKEIPLRSDSER